jgi:hypothetical protein
MALLAEWSNSRRKADSLVSTTRISYKILFVCLLKCLLGLTSSPPACRLEVLPPFGMGIHPTSHPATRGYNWVCVPRVVETKENPQRIVPGA